MKLLWLDLETTGLDSSKHDILEVACCFADFERPFNASMNTHYQSVVSFDPPVFPGTDVISQYVVDMHTKNGLWYDCRNTHRSITDVENDLLQIVPEAKGDERPILAGSTISFDMSFVRSKMPRLAARLHYRLYDVTTIKLFCQSMGMTVIPKAEAHRAMMDVCESIEHGRFCVEWLESNGFKVPSP